MEQNLSSLEPKNNWTLRNRWLWQTPNSIEEAFILNPALRKLELPWGYTSEYFESGNPGSQNKLIYVHGLFGNAYIFQRQMSDQRFQDAHHIWLDFYNPSYISDHRKRVDAFDISENYLNLFLDQLEISNAVFIGTSLWWERILRYTDKNSHRVKWAVIASSSWLKHERINLLEVWEQWNFASIINDSALTRQLVEAGFEYPNDLPDQMFELAFQKYILPHTYKSFLIWYVKPLKESSSQEKNYSENKRRLRTISRSWIPVMLWRGKKDRITPFEQYTERQQSLWTSLTHQCISDTSGHALYLDDYKNFNNVMFTYLKHHKLI